MPQDGSVGQNRAIGGKSSTPPILTWLSLSSEMVSEKSGGGSSSLSGKSL